MVIFTINAEKSYLIGNTVAIILLKELLLEIKSSSA